MNNRENFIKLLEVGKLKSGLTSGEVTDTERMNNAIKDYTINQEDKDLRLYRNFMNSSSYDDIKEVQVPSYRGDVER